MGTTIRREPVNFKIPGEQDYKYLNITDFRGISKSSNPLTQSYNTASDALNVYVDETNALTTRPRLEEFADLKNEIPGLDEVISVFNISDGFLIQCIVNGDWKLYKKTLTTSASLITGTSVNSKITAVFEQDEKIYFINGSNYYVITVNNGAYTVNYVEGYIPTISVGGTVNNKGSKFETVNLLINKYKESYFWDGESELDAFITDPSDVVQNRYSKGITKQLSNDYDVLRILEESLENINHNTLYDMKMLVKKHSDDTKLYWATISGNNVVYDALPEVPDTGVYVYSGDCSSNGSVVAYYCGNGNVYVLENDEWSHLTTQHKSSHVVDDFEYNFYALRMSADGSKILTLGDDANGYTVQWMFIYKQNDVWTVKQSTAKNESRVYFGELRGVDFSRNGDVGILIGYSNPDVYGNGRDGLAMCAIKNFSTNFGKDLNDMQGFDDNLHLSQAFYPWVLTGTPHDHPKPKHSMSDTGEILWFEYNTWQETQQSPWHNSLYLIDWKSNGYDFKGVPETTPWVQQLASVDWYQLSSDYEKIYYFKTNESGYIKISDKSIVNDSFENLNIGTEYTSFQKFYGVKNYFFIVSKTTMKLKHWYYDLQSTEPLIEVIKTINSDNEYYTSFTEQSTLFYKSLLTTRFNNEHWFASGNKTFYTQYNDPTYIPMNSYNINGDQDDITAMNVLSDSILGLYKKDDLWLVQQTYDSDGNVVYYYNENNNVVGNNAFNAAITTIHSNLPIQITYDGIYTIQQQENVSTPDRLAKSISDPIAYYWLKESKASIDNAQTLNRLYWTYVLLPVDDDLTKVYLLDNRTLSWYYWELPIKLVNAFVKNEIVYIADDLGRLAVLKTDDVTKILSDKVSISEYYDFDRQIINWYWESQILPLGTINYTKKLVNTTFIVTDTDENDGYSLQYQFKVYRRKMGVTNVKNVTNKLNYVQSVTKKTFISRFNFLQLKLSNMYDDLDNNKLRLVGLGLKYVLLEGML